MRISDWSSDVCSSDLNIGTMPPGGIIAKPSFTISPNGNVQLGPLFLMEKMEAGWHPESKNWRYTMVMPDGTVAGRTHGQNAEAVECCVGCHASVAEAQDSLFFIPEEERKSTRLNSSH